MYFAKEGYAWVFIGLFFTLLSYFNLPHTVGFYWPTFALVTLPLAIVTGFMIFFFRDPNRKPESNYNPECSILTPADGSICAIEEENGDLAVYIEMHAVNVHVTRAHLSGTVKKITRIGGRHHPIYFLKKKVGSESRAIRKNARVIMEIEDEKGRTFLYHLICGKMARRAKPYAKVGQFINEGDRLGVISFGSLVKVTLPGLEYRMIAKIGDTVHGGKTILCEKIKPEKIDNYDDSFELESQYLATDLRERILN